VVELFARYFFETRTSSAFDYTLVGALTEADCIIEAMDQHCSSLVEKLLDKEYIREKLQNYVNQEFYDTKDTLVQLVGKALWFFRSSINYKTKILSTVISHDETHEVIALKKKLHPIANIINNEADKIATGMISWQFTRPKR